MVLKTSTPVWHTRRSSLSLKLCDTGKYIHGLLVCYTNRMLKEARWRCTDSTEPGGIWHTLSFQIIEGRVLSFEVPGHKGLTDKLSQTVLSQNRGLYELYEYLVILFTRLYLLPLVFLWSVWHFFRQQVLWEYPSASCKPQKLSDMSYMPQ